MKVSDFENIISVDRPLLVDFFASWCGPCRVMQPIVKEFVDRMGGEVDFLGVDVDLHDSQPLVDHYRVMSVPTLLLFRSGRILWRNSGVMSLEKMLDVVRQLQRTEVYY